MPHLRRSVPLRPLAGLVAGATLLVAGCSEPAPTDVPPPAATVASAPAPSASPSVTASPTPSTSPTPAAGRRSATRPPSASSAGSVVPSRAVETAAPKKLDEPTRTAGAEVSLVSVRAATISASGPGDSSGPGVLVRLRLVNTTGKDLDTSFVQVNVADDRGDPGTLVSGAPTDPLTGSVKPGRRAEATYAFLLGDVGSAPVTVAVYVTSGQPVVTFRGRAS